MSISLYQIITPLSPDPSSGGTNCGARNPAGEKATPNGKLYGGVGNQRRIEAEASGQEFTEPPPEPAGSA